MLEEFINRVITDLERTGQWPPMQDIKATMRKIAAEMEREAPATPIVAADPEPPTPEPVEAGQHAEPVTATTQEARAQGLIDALPETEPAAPTDPS